MVVVTQPNSGLLLTQIVFYSDSSPQQSKKIKTSEKSKSPVKVTDKVSTKVQDKAPEKAQANTSEKAQVTKLASIFTARK